MFRKLQLKFFAFTTSVILALFVAMLVAINVIMDVVMQQESKVVLKQIASSIEYDDETSTFTYFELKDPPPDLPDQPPNDLPPIEPNNGTTSGTDTPTDPSTDVPGSSQGYSPTDPEGTLPPQTSAPYTQGSTTQTAPQTSGSAQTTTQPVKPTDPHIQTGIPQEPATYFEEPPQERPTEPYPPFEQQYPTRPPREDQPYYDPNYNEDDNRNNYEDNNNNNNNNKHDNYYQYPEPVDPNYQQYYEALPYQSEEPTAAAATAAAQLSFNSFIDKITPLSASIGVPFGNVMPAAVENQRWEEAPVPKSLGSIEFFALMADPSGNYLASLNNDDLTNDTAQNYVTSVLRNDGSEGMLNQLQYCTLAKPNGTIMVFTDRSASFDMLDQLTRTTIIIGIIAFLFITVLTFFLSKKSIQPVKTAFEKQKQFISDASHELKTPLTIISANTDVLTDEIGDNKWLEYIRSQTDRMNILVNDLLNLTRLENNTAAVIFTDFNLSKAVENTALPFECQAFEMNKTLEIDIQDEVMINGSEQHIKQMTAIFIDNALKYSNEGGKVRVSLKTQNDKPVLSVYNTGMGIKESEKEKIFERFYRVDDSRARTTGGYGLGLAIAKTIIDKHKFKVSIDNTEGVSVCFNIFM